MMCPDCPPSVADWGRVCWIHHWSRGQTDMYCAVIFEKLLCLPRGIVIRQPQRHEKKLLQSKWVLVAIEAERPV